MAVIAPRAPTHVLATGYWLLLAILVIPAAALYLPQEAFACTLIAASLTCSLFFPKARGAALFVTILLFPRALEFNAGWSWILSFREPAKDVKFPAQITMVDLALVVACLSSVWPKMLHRERVLSHANGWGWAYFGVFLCSTLLGGGTYGPPYDAEFIALSNFLRGLLLWLTLVNGEEGEGHAVRLSLAFALCAAISSASAVAKYFFGGPMTAGEQWEARGEAFNMNANSFSAMMVMAGAVGLGLLCLSKKRWEQWFGFGLFWIGAVGVGVALSRAGIAVFFLTATIMLSRHRRDLLLLWIAVLVAVVGYVMTTPDVNGRLQLFQSGVEATEDNVRGLVYEQSYGMFRDNWVLGVGPYRYFDASIPYIPTGIYRNVTHSHSLPMQVFVDTGIFGGALAFLVFLAWWRRGWSTLRMRLPDHPWRVGAAVGIVGALAMQLTDSLLLDVRFFACFALLLAILVTGPRDTKPRRDVPARRLGRREIRLARRAA